MSTQQTRTIPDRSAGAASRNQVKLSLPSDREIVISREFAVPRERLFDVFSQAEHLRRWYGCETMSVRECTIDLRPGGKYRIVLDDVGGGSHAFSGEYREIERPSHLVFTERYEAVPGSDHLVTQRFDEVDGKTRFTQLMQYPSQQHRDGHLQSGMENGLPEQFARVEALARELVVGS